METISRMFEHLHWANRRLLDALQVQGVENAKALRLFSHILYAERIWLARLRGEDHSRLPIWSETSSLPECADLVRHNVEGYSMFFREINKSNLDLHHLISYTNSRGQPFQTSIRDILTHVALHGQYHRGQVNALLRQAGADPVSLDFIMFAREVHF